MKNHFSTLIHRCGLSIAGCARLLQVSPHTVKAWKYGKRNTPPGVIYDLEQYARAAERIFGKAAMINQRAKK